MAPGQPRRGIPQPLGIDSYTVEFDIEVGSHAPQLLIVVAAHPQSVLDRRQREGFVVLGLIVAGTRAVSARVPGGTGRRRAGRCGGVVSGDEVRPRSYGRVGGQIGEPDGDALPAPTPRQRHHPDGVQAGRDQIGMRIQLVRTHAEQFGDFVSNRLRSRHRHTHKASSVKSGCPNFVEATLYSVHRTLLPRADDFTR